MFYTIYKVTHIQSGKEYIGMHQTNNIDDGYMGSGKHLRRALKKHGVQDFHKEIMYIFDNPHEMIAKEIELVTEEYVKRSDTYNIRLGGKGGFEHVFADTTSRRTHNVRVSGLRGENGFDRRLYSDVYSKNGANLHAKMLERFPKSGFYGKKRTDEWKENHSKIMKEKQSGEKNSQYGRTWVWHELYGNKKIHKDDLDVYTENGWIKTRKIGYQPPINTA